MTALPLIGLSTSQPTEAALGRLFNGVSRRYAEGLTAVGTLPVMLPTLPDLAETYAAQVDAVLLTGGVDVHPRHFGQHPVRGLGVVDEERDAFEAALYHAARRLGKPVFGICRGIQMINVLEGGTLHQHLPEVAGIWVDHTQLATPPALGHEVIFAPGSRLGEEHGPRAFVNSYHHQAIDRLAPTLQAVAWAPDGLIEAVEGEGLMAVQWHPELLLSRHRHALASFQAFRKLV
ncbi:gamma-glutamyl-gamma-aminobutyrate hydrolase family protein [Deinococcus navajonensis]|uniref:Gamma-glutamyl-gamma-aminobutyrate hydrolase family protein n=1 Tax=Deinococcus navajonensis TaxID=309884 RepID=A0ABV8XGF4_9DEIO